MTETFQFSPPNTQEQKEVLRLGLLGKVMLESQPALYTFGAKLLRKLLSNFQQDQIPLPKKV